jgi:carboxymethylenebutenolidase
MRTLRTLVGSIAITIAGAIILQTVSSQTPVDGAAQMTTSQPRGFLAEPRSGSGPGVLVLHAWWGLNDTIREFCNRLADEGFVVFAPDLYHGEVATTIPEAERLGQALDAEFRRARAEIAEATAWLHEHAGVDDRGLAVIGFSMGAFYALDLSASEPDRISSVVLFYGSGDAEFASAQAMYLGHFAENDEFEPEENVQALEQSLRQAGRPVTFHRYPGAGHWFFEPDRTDAYDDAAASLAWERTIEFLNR